jgi:hypothetical protein
MSKPFPVVQLEPTASPERFRQWASQFGTSRLGRSLGVDVRSIDRYLQGTRTVLPATARRIIALSILEPLDGEPLTYEDIYGPARASRVEVRSVQKAKPWE